MRPRRSSAPIAGASRRPAFPPPCRLVASPASASRGPADRGEIVGHERRATDQPAVDVDLLEQLVCVGRLDRAAVDDPHACRPRLAVDTAGKTPTELAREVETKLAEFVQDPIVTIIVTSFGDATDQTVRVVGEAQQPVSVPYRANMTVLDLMVAVGGLTEFAAGNRAVLVRGQGPEKQVYGLRLDDLINGGDVAANTPVLPGDIIIVPKSLL